MSMTVTEIESAIEQLPPKKVSELSEWFAEDLQNGRLQKLIDEARKDFVEGKCQSL